MSESINTNKSTKQFMVLDRISKRIEYADRSLGIIKINNSDMNHSKPAPISVIGSCLTKEGSLCEKE
jgi:hypothetical protein